MKFLKWFIFLGWFVLCGIIKYFYIPTNWQYSWGVFAGVFAMVVLDIFDSLLENR